MQKRIAILMPTLFGGGGQRSMLNLAHGLADKGYRVDLVLVKLEGEFMAEVQSKIRIVDLKASRTLTSMPGLIRYLRRERPDAMISVFGFVNIVALSAWRLAGVPTKLYVVEQNTVSQEAGNHSSWRGRITPSLMRRVYPWANGIIVVSQGVREDMAQLTGIPSENIQVIFNPSIVRKEVLEKAQSRVEHPWLEDGRTPVILAVGRLQMQKDYPTLIRAFARVRKNMPARLLILGEGIDRSSLEAMIQEHGLEQDVDLHGFVKNPYAYMARASLFVLSSRWEGLPTVLIEALCCGLPVVSTDCPSGPREILQDGKYGILTPVGDPDSLAQAIQSKLENTRNSPPPESWQPYELNSVVGQYENLIFGN